MSEEKKKEETYDPYRKYKEFKWESSNDLKNGPISDETRKCRDCCCCLIFLLFVVAWVAIAILGFKNGQPLKLIYSYDEDGNACGYDPGYENYSLLYFYNVIGNTEDLNITQIVNGICVSSCPNETHEKTDKIILECVPTKNNTDCRVDFKNYYKSKNLLNKFCFPIKIDEKTYNSTTQELIKIFDPSTQEFFEKVVAKDMVSEDSEGNKLIRLDMINGLGDPADASGRLINWSFFSVDRLASWMCDLVVTKWAILGSLLWSFVLGIFFLLFLRVFAGFIIILIILIILSGLLVLAVYFRSQSKKYFIAGDKTYSKAMEALFWICLVIAIIWFIFILVMCNRIRLAISLTKVTAKYVGQNFCIVFIPFLFFLIIVLWIVYWVFLSIFLYSTGDFDKENSKVIATFNWNAKIRYSWWFHLFSLFYMCEIITAYSEFVYASSACIWYYTYEKGTEGHLIRKSFHRGFRYHFGSLAFGALIIAIIRFLMLIVETLKKKIEKTYSTKQQSKCFKCVICCLQCCLNCIGRTMEFVNKHAYIQIALKGENFCTSAWEGFGLMIRNIGRFSVLALIGGLFSILGTLFISVSSGIIGYFLITKVKYFSEDLNSCVLPVFCFVVIGFVIGYVTMSIFGISGDALIHCFLMDEELNKGQPKAFPELQSFMQDER